jgi:hypothetical protein
LDFGGGDDEAVGGEFEEIVAGVAMGRRVVAVAMR